MRKTKTDKEKKKEKRKEIKKNMIKLRTPNKASGASPQGACTILDYPTGVNLCTRLESVPSLEDLSMPQATATLLISLSSNYYRKQ